MGELETIRYEAIDGVGWLWLNRPDRLNGMTNLMLHETAVTAGDVAADESVPSLTY